MPAHPHAALPSALQHSHELLSSSGQQQQPLQQTAAVMLINIFRFYRSSPRFLIIALLVTCVNLWYFRAGIQSAWAIVNLPFVWNRNASEFLISKVNDDFDLTFANYSTSMDSSLPTYPDLVPPVLHHIALGHNKPPDKWVEARQACLDYHEGWEAHLWTDENASAFVQEYFPQFKHTWDRYKYPIQRIDALRYMVLYEYGGVVLDMDLKCTRSLGPLRRFGFVAPSAHPTGFSIGFMMASKRNAFVGELVRNLKIYNHHWFGLPYPTVMFSTGCHYASSIHTLQTNRQELKILAGPKDNPKLHSLNGDVVTPLFHHLGTSSWHSYDASLIVSIGKGSKWLRLVFVGFIVGVLAMVAMAMRAKRRSPHHHHEGRDAFGKKIPVVEFDGRIA